MILKNSAERDISEKIALGLAQPTLSKDSMFDQRLFNQSSGMSSGFGGEDAYNIYDKALFTGSSSAAIYRPKRTTAEGGGDDLVSNAIPGVRADRIERIVDGAAAGGGSSSSGSSKAPHRGFQGAEGGGRGGTARDGPVQFEKELDEADPFGLEQFMTSAKRGKEEIPRERGSMATS